MRGRSVEADFFNVVVLIEAHGVYTLVDPEAGTCCDPRIHLMWVAPLQTDQAPAIVVVIIVLHDLLPDVVVLLIVSMPLIQDVLIATEVCIDLLNGILSLQVCNGCGRTLAWLGVTTGFKLL